MAPESNPVDSEFEKEIRRFLQPPQPIQSHQRDKSKNTPEFNKKWKKRRAKEKQDAKGRKVNRRKK